MCNFAKEQLFDQQRSKCSRLYQCPMCKPLSLPTRPVARGGPGGATAPPIPSLAPPISRGKKYVFVSFHYFFDSTPEAIIAIVPVNPKLRPETPCIHNSSFHIQGVHKVFPGQRTAITLLLINIYECGFHYIVGKNHKFMFVQVLTSGIKLW